MTEAPEWAADFMREQPIVMNDRHQMEEFDNVFQHHVCHHMCEHNQHQQGKRWVLLAYWSQTVHTRTSGSWGGGYLGNFFGGMQFDLIVAYELHNSV
jgi:hypothetical protein